MPEPRDDPEFWLSAGVDVATRTWVSIDSLSNNELREVGRAQIQDADYGAGAQSKLDAAHPELERRPGRR